MLEEYRREYVDFNTAAMREYYLFLSGQKSALEIASIYDRYSDLFTKDSIARLKRELADSPVDFETQRAAVNRLLGFAVDHFLENSVAELTEDIGKYEAAATVEWQGRRLSFQDSIVAVQLEPDRELRRALYKKRERVIDQSNDLRAERLEKLHQAARSLGYAGYAALYQEVRGLDYGALAVQLEALLARTESVYASSLNAALTGDLNITVEQAERSDAHRFLHLSSYDHHFPAANLLRVYADTMAGLGIDVVAQQNITIDSEPRPRKNSRAFCVAITAPDDVRLVVKPSGGQSDYQALFHEGGHAQHYGGVDQSLQPEFKYTGDYALTETFAFLFDHLTSEPAWLEDMLRFRDSADYVRSSVVSRLVTIRRYAAKLIYERELHTTGNIAEAARRYSELQTSATMFKTARTDFLFDMDDAFYSASYLRAWAFEVVLREHLKLKFGDRWWTSRRAGNYLREIWETGDRYTADEMAAQLGLGPIAFDPLIEEFVRALR